MLLKVSKINHKVKRKASFDTEKEKQKCVDLRINRAKHLKNRIQMNVDVFEVSI